AVERGHRPPANPDAALEVVGDHGDDGGGGEDVEEPAEGDVEQRELENIEADVEPEDGVFEGEVLPGGEQEDVVPPGRHPHPHEESQQQREDQTQAAGAALYPVAESGDDLLFVADVGGKEAGSKPLRQVEREPEDDECDEAAGGTEAEPDGPAFDPHRREPEGVEPQVVGPQGPEGGEGEVDGEGTPEQIAEPAASLRGLATRGGCPREHFGDCKDKTRQPSRGGSDGHDRATAVPVG